jgi:PIN domain nuclease of toxin-antitoxin system
MSKLLLDTHVFLWLAADDPRLPVVVKTAFVDKRNELYLSVASIWEIAIKVSIGKLILTTPTEALIKGGQAQGIRILGVTAAHALAVEHLPFHHRDPFDRLLIAQARADKMRLVSGDAQFDSYAIEKFW